MRLLWAILLVMCSIVSVQANEHTKQDAQSIVNKVHPNINAAIQGGVNFKGSGDTGIKEIINYQGTDIKEIAYKDQAAREAALAAMQKEPNDARDVMEASFLRQKEYKIDKNSPIWDNAKQAQAHPERYVDWITGKYEDCKQDGGDAMLSKEHKVCDEYNTVEERSCIMGRAIVVDSKHKYECTKSLDKIFKRCTKNLVVSIQEDQNCAADIVSHPTLPESVRRDGKHAYININVRSSKNFANYLTFGLGVFRISDLDKITEVVIEEITAPSVVEVKLEDQLLFEGQKPLSPMKGMRGNYENYLAQKRNQIIETKALNKDIKPILKADWNGLSVRSIIDATVTIKLRITKQCIIEKDEWVESCTETKEVL